jgi:hypothetical protein
VPSPNEEQFEKYLKEFCPLTPDPEYRARSPFAGRRSPLPVARAAVVAAVLLGAALLVHYRHDSPQTLGDSRNAAGPGHLADPQANPQPLTIGTANRLLALAPSYKAAIDRLAFQPPATQFLKNRHSALAALSQENIRL